MNESDPRALLNDLLKQVLKARLCCNRIRSKMPQALGTSDIHTMSEAQIQQRMNRFVSEAPMPGSLKDVDPKDLKEAALKFLSEATQFMTDNSDVINSQDTDASKQLRVIEEQLDGVVAAITTLKESLLSEPSSE